MTYIIKLGIIIFNLIYSILKLLPQKDKVAILSRQSNIPSLDIDMLNKEIQRSHPEYETVILCRTLNGSLFNKAKYGFHMFTQMYHLATSKIVVIDSYCILVSILCHKDSLLIVQMWHSVGTMKKFGYSILNKKEGSSSKIAHLMKMHSNYDYILIAGDGYREHLAEGFNYPPDKIITLPLPRVEALKDSNVASEKQQKIYAEYPQFKDKTTIVYVPTFRKKDDADFIKALSSLCESIDYEKYNLVIKPHPLTDLNEFDSKKAIVDKKFSSFDMLFVSDIVVSDYSCIIYEAAVLNRPIYFYTYDYEEYMETRDIYMDFLAEVPGPVCDNSDELIDEIEKNEYDMDKLNAFLNKYVYMGSEHETKDIVDFMFKQLYKGEI